MDLYDEFRGLIECLNRNSVDYAVCGGIAVAVHGYPRFTYDIDLLIRPEDLRQTLDVAKSCGFLDESGNIPLGTSVAYRIVKAAGADHLVLDLSGRSRASRGLGDACELRMAGPDAACRIGDRVGHDETDVGARPGPSGSRNAEHEFFRRRVGWVQRILLTCRPVRSIAAYVSSRAYIDWACLCNKAAAWDALNRNRGRRSRIHPNVDSADHLPKAAHGIPGQVFDRI